MPRLIRVVCGKKGILLAQTEVVFAINKDTGDLHEIGSFFIFLVRKRIERMWTVDFRFINESGKIDHCHHPHIADSEFPTINMQTGRYCIREGQHGIYQAIREARIVDAMTQLIEILHLENMHQGMPYKPIGNWPIAEKGFVRP